MKVLPGVKQIHSITDAIFQSLVAHIDSDLCEKEDDKVLALLKEVMLGLLPEQTTDNILCQLKSDFPKIWRMLKNDAAAALARDPAAESISEVVIAYPYMKVMSVHRIANFLYVHKVPLIPRLLNERTHRETGIDIHPGATIGESFFIDHGTGVVIGETTVIGNNVTIYQGVTLGAYKFPKDACGAFVQNTKRHPTIKDNVTIYSNASILGNITIEKGAVIGSNVWINKSVPENTMVIMKMPEMVFRPIVRDDKK